jgi:hypothetical protein
MVNVDTAKIKGTGKFWERSERATENAKIRFSGKKCDQYREEKHF